MAEDRVHDEAFVTLATNDTYALGCLVLGSSLQRVSTTRQLVVMITSGVSASMRQQLDALFDQTVEVNVLDSSDTCNLELLGRPDLSCTFTKFHCWRLTQYKKCVFMDADTLVLQNIDDLFDREELSAAPDAGWPDCFNSGVFVLVPSEETYRSLLAFAVTSGSFDGGDQGLLNSYFRGWATEDIGKHLPFTYNVVSQAFYSYLPAFKEFRNNVKVVHFIGAVKPWHQPFNTATGQVTALPDTGHSQEFLQIWWNIFMETVQPDLDPTLRAGVRLRHEPSSHPVEHGDSQHDQSNNLHHHHHHHHHDQHQQHHQPTPPHGHSETRGAPTTTYDVVYPYTPPQLGDPGPNNPPPPPAEESPQVLSVPVVYRDYQVLETHYSEPPLSSVNPELPPSEHYGARESLQGRPFQPTTGGEDKRSTNAGDSEERSEDNRTDAEARSSHRQKEREGCKHGHGTDKMPNAKEANTDENANPKPKTGIVGDLANLSLGGGGGGGEGSSVHRRDDRERKLQWEQGQADYMGVDRFDNIMARLDQKIAEPQKQPAAVAVPVSSRMAEGDAGTGKVSLDGGDDGSSSAHVEHETAPASEVEESSSGEAVPLPSNQANDSTVAGHSDDQPAEGNTASAPVGGTDGSQSADVGDKAGNQEDNQALAGGESALESPQVCPASDPGALSEPEDKASPQSAADSQPQVTGPTAESADAGQPPVVDSGDVGQPLASESDVGQSEGGKGADVVQPGTSKTSDVSQPPVVESVGEGQSARAESADVGQPPKEESADVDQPPKEESADVGQPPKAESADVGQHTKAESADVGQSSKEESADVGQPTKAESADAGQPPATEDKVAPSTAPSTENQPLSSETEKEIGTKATEGQRLAAAPKAVVVADQPTAAPAAKLVALDKRPAVASKPVAVGQPPSIPPKPVSAGQAPAVAPKPVAASVPAAAAPAPAPKQGAEASKPVKTQPVAPPKPAAQPPAPVPKPAPKTLPVLSPKPTPVNPPLTPAKPTAAPKPSVAPPANAAKQAVPGSNADPSPVGGKPEPGPVKPKLKPWAPGAKSQPQPQVQSPTKTPTAAAAAPAKPEAPPVLAPKPASPTKPSSLAQAASKFESPVTTTSASSGPPKPSPTNSFALMASKFGGSVAKPAGRGATSPTSPTTGASLSPAAAPAGTKAAPTVAPTGTKAAPTVAPTGTKAAPTAAPTGTKAATAVAGTKPAGASAGTKPSGSPASSAAKPATNREEMLSRFGVRLAPKK